MGWNSTFFHGATGGASGTDTSDATMLAGDIVSPKTGYGAAGTKLTGTLIKNPTVDPLVINPNVVMYPIEAAWLLSEGGFTGTLSNLPPDCKYIWDEVGGVSGDLSDIPSVCTVVFLQSAEITGVLSDLPTGLIMLMLSGCSLITGVYSPNATIGYISLSYTGMSAADTDATLIALAAITTVVGEISTCGNRTSASDSAVTALLTAGWTVNGQTLP